MPKYQRKCRLEGDALVIKGISNKVSDLHKLPDDLNGENISCRMSPESYGFFGKLHPFSSFNPVKIKFQGLDYHSSEQIIQHLKASYFGDEDTAQKIMDTKTALEYKILSREIKDYEHEDWCSITKNMYEPGIKAKFKQNPILRKKLLSTKGKTLVECCSHYIWGLEFPLMALIPCVVIVGPIKEYLERCSRNCTMTTLSMKNHKNLTVKLMYLELMIQEGLKVIWKVKN